VIWARSQVGSGLSKVHRRGNPAPPAGEGSDGCLYGAARTERVAVIALGFADSQPVGMVAVMDTTRASVSAFLMARAA
jgi:hypothetical protein